MVFYLFLREIGDLSLQLLTERCCQGFNQLDV